MLPMNRRSDSSCRVAGPPRKRGRRELREASGTRPRPFSMQKFAGEVGVASLDAGVALADDELSENVVVVEAPARSVGLGADRAEGIKQFEQADVVAALALHDGKGIVGSGGVDGEMFFRSSGGQQGREEQ